ncbi:MAG: acyl-CoA dehydrogenase [Ramlibacter sp.]|nr:acyl-CoA dehydrogenase [Ramlibacter sp.]
MEMHLSDEQRQLDDGVARLMADRYGFDARQKIAAQAPGWSTAMWGSYAEMGLLAIATPSEHGGLDGGGAELLPVMQAFGRALVQEPYLASAVLSATALAGCTNEAVKSELLPRMAAGDYRCAFAHEERGVPLDDTQLRASRAGQGWQLSGRKCAVLHAAAADALIVSARSGDGSEGVALFLVQADAVGLARRDFTLIDQRSASDLQFAQAPATLLMGPSRATRDVIRRTLDVGVAALCAEMVGAMRGALEMTTKYLATRKQFGRPLSDNQVLRHRCAEMLVAIETCEAMAWLAAIAVDAPDSAEPERDLARAKLLVGHHGRWVGEQVIQLHGGIGMTDEYAVGHYLQRLTVNDNLLGNQDAQLDRLLAH